MFKTRVCLFLLYLLTLSCFAQTDTTITLSFDFNDHQFKEKDNKVIIKAVGATLIEDRFGNENSAVRVMGNPYSYINLGTSNLLKPKCGSISMWVNIQEKVFAGKGAEANPFLVIHNGPGEDFNEAIGLGCTWVHNRLGAKARADSVQTVTVSGRDTIIINTWYHLITAWDDDDFAFYVNGQLQQKLKKGFRSRFFEGDSVIVGRLTGTKNIRYTHALIDDIRFYHRVLNEQEIKALYNEPNPNRFRNILNEILKYSIVVIVLVIVIVIISIRNKRALRRQKEYYELNNKIQELEIKVIKTQINPHFISNSLAAIQNLILNKEVEKAAQYLAKFSFFLREVLNYSDKTYIRLEEELKIIKLNIELEHLRFKNNFTFNIHVDNAIDPTDVLIPSLITQPFIENAIWHGLLPLKDRDPKLDIRVISKNEIIFIEIEDNGVGRSRDGSLPGKNSKGTKLATDKIESINKLRNSNDFKLEIIDLVDENKIPSGTKIIIQLMHFNHEE